LREDSRKGVGLLFDKHLRENYREDWFNSANLEEDQKKNIGKAKDKAIRQWRAQRLQGNPDRGKIIVNLSLGFWVNLFLKDYTHNHLKNVFRNIKVDESSRILKFINNVRNELAHHEPVITWDGIRDKRNLESIMKDLDKILRDRLIPLRPGTLFVVVRPLWL
jgi:hypothetical protein